MPVRSAVTVVLGVALFAASGCGGRTPAHTSASPPLGCGTLDLPAQSSPGVTTVSTTVTATARIGTLRASLTASSSVPADSPAGIVGPHLLVADGATTLASTAINAPEEAQLPNGVVVPGFISVTPTETPAETPDRGSDICLARFAGQLRPTLLIGFYTGGAHCCSLLRAYPVSATAVGAPVDVNLGDPGATLRVVGDHVLLITGDDSFAYQFDSFAGSGFPIKVLEFQAGGFADTTHAHLDLVRADADFWWGLATGSAGYGLGVLAAWVADECVLGQATQAWATIDGLQGEGKLTGTGGAFDGSSAATFPAALRTFLAKAGYCS